MNSNIKARQLNWIRINKYRYEAYIGVRLICTVQYFPDYNKAVFFKFWEHGTQDITIESELKDKEVWPLIHNYCQKEFERLVKSLIE